MLQDIAPHIYHNPMSFVPPAPGDLALAYAGGQVLARLEEGLLQLPRVEQCTGASGWIYGFSIDETHYYLPQGPALQAPGFSMVSNYRALAPGQTVFACAVGESLARWYAGNRFCGACGRSLEPSTLERALVCPTCGRTVYPKICPAVIVAVCHGDRLLLTKYAGRSFRRYALVAGFNEIGESIEETVQREVLEETGLQVDNLRFYKSQPWVVTDSLLFGFFAELAGPDCIHLQEEELAEAQWFPRNALPTDHSSDSLTGEMIENLPGRKGTPISGKVQKTFFNFVFSPPKYLKLGGISGIISFVYADYPPVPNS